MKLKHDCYLLLDEIIWDNKNDIPVDEETGEHYPEHHQQKETHRIYVKGDLGDDQYFFAWEYFKDARWVRSSFKEAMGNDETTRIYVYEVEVTYPSPEEQYEEARYGWSYEDDYDY